jgi:hypothetical protein
MLSNMPRPSTNGLSTLLLGILAVAACQPCNRDGCDALQSRAADTGSGRIAGVAASESDAVSNGCQECAFASGTGVSAWAVEQAVTTDDELRAATSGAPTATATCSEAGQYALPLAAGAYLVCFQNSCFNASVLLQHTTTLNVRLINGVSRGFLAEGGGNTLSALDAMFLPPS